MALTKPFAENGNKTTIPDNTVDGSVSYDQGFGAFYALPPEEGGLFIDRAQFNQLMYDTTSAVISNQNSINSLNSSVNTLNEKVADIEGGVATGVVNLTTNQTIGGVKTFSVPPVSATNPTNNNQVANKAYVDTVGNTAVKLTGVQTIQGVKTFSSIPVSATQPTNANQIANKAYVDAIAATKPGFITRTLAIGANEELKNLSDFRLFAMNNFANYYILSLTSDIIQTEAVVLRGINCSFNSTNYTIALQKTLNIHYGSLRFGRITLKLEGDSKINFLCSNFSIEGDVTFTDLVSDSSKNSSAIALSGSNFMAGGNDNWNITTTSRSFISLSGSRAQIVNINFTGSIASQKNLFIFNLQGLLMTQSCNFGGLAITDITQNQLTNKGIWFNV